MNYEGAPKGAPEIPATKSGSSLTPRPDFPQRIRRDPSRILLDEMVAAFDQALLLFERAR